MIKQDDMIELYKKFDDLFDTRNFEEADNQIELFLKGENSAQLCVALLVECFQWQRCLKNYFHIIPYTRKKILDEGATEEQADKTLRGFDRAPDSLLLFKKEK